MNVGGVMFVEHVLDWQIFTYALVSGAVNLSNLKDTRLIVAIVWNQQDVEETVFAMEEYAVHHNGFKTILKILNDFYLFLFFNIFVYSYFDMLFLSYFYVYLNPKNEKIQKINKTYHIILCFMNT